MTETTTLPISSITVGKRHRQDMGNIQHLADSIRDIGLLQPIGVNPEHQLVFGHRRLEACRSLGWESIQVRIVDAPAIMAEHDENEIRKDFTPSERMAIGREIEEAIGNRSGQRMDIIKPEPRENFPEVKPGQRTSDIAAQHAGFGNYKTYQQAKVVVDHGTPELVEAMDRGDISISAAATIAKLPPTEQQAVVAGGKDAVLGYVRQARDAQSENRAEKSESAQTPVSVDGHACTAMHANPESEPDSVPEQSKSGVQTMLAGLSGNCEWYTPSKWVEMARTAMGSIDVDPASHYVAQRTVQADDWYDQERDGLKHDWPGNVWLNPPYARGLIEAFIEKVVSQFQSGITEQAVILVDSRSDTKWFHALCSAASAVAFTKGRVNFYNQSTESSSPVSGSAFVYLGSCPDMFHAAFSMECLVLYPATRA
ncbi:DNA N-6-adenine-methyltransferase [Candidatus Magnetaquicoccus inordinatus]|uniref:DNA N-6-adenine-methyltransferase n=1 Tax=Candidatus Magnetaquicoccus inordinatus TaxID=2496818 RepID=UPI00187D59B4|nr:DNA N-6-adenine-methyltransferase [Candidatus Magnetaquicoccus inordinatus]